MYVVRVYVRGNEKTYTYDDIVDAWESYNYYCNCDNTDFVEIRIDDEIAGIKA